MTPAAFSTGRTRVYLTVDVEGAEERSRGGQPQPALGYDVRVWGRFPNQRRALGLPRLLEELRRHDLRATFFVEPFGSVLFGADGLKEICETLRNSGQDIQLHTHPVQKLPDWRTRGEEPLPDDMAAYDVRTQAALLAEGLSLLRAAGAEPTRLLGFRAGNFGANNDTWKAMARAGLVLSSNFNLCYLRRNCRMSWPVPGNALFPVGEGVWELPISNFREARGNHRHLQITAISFAEMRAYLEEARRLRIPEVTVVTHTFELFFLDAAAPARGHPNWINIHRWRQLCRFLSERRDDFEVDTVGALAARLRQATTPEAETIVRPTAAPIPDGHRGLRLQRLVEQGLKRASAYVSWG
jgi:hypothetical protein